MPERANQRASKRHLLIVIHSLRGGGAERVAVDLAAYWTHQGYRVTLATQADAGQDAYALDPDVERVVLGGAAESGGGMRGLAANAVRVWRLRRLIRRIRPDIVLGMMTTASILSVLAARGLSCKVIASEHTHPPVQKLSASWQRLREKAYPRARAVVALTAGTAQWLEQHVPGVNVSIIPNAVRWPLPETEPVLDAGRAPGRKRLLAVGRLHQVKGFDLLLQAFARIASYFPDWDLAIVGEGPEREALEQQVDELGLLERVALPGRAGNIGQWYESADMYVLSSRTEGLSNTLLEAMASGLPAVAFDCDTGPREIIRRGIDGILVEPAGDPEALAAHLSHLMANPEEREAYARRAVDVRDRFCTVRVMGLWRQLFES